MARSSPIRCGPKIRNGSECVPERKLFNSSGGNPATTKGFMIIRLSVETLKRTNLYRFNSLSVQPFIEFVFCSRPRAAHTLIAMHKIEDDAVDELLQPYG